MRILISIIGAFVIGILILIFGLFVFYLKIRNYSFKTGYMDKTGKFVIKPRVMEAFPFSDGLAAVCFHEDPRERDFIKWGFIDKKGRIVIKDKYRAVSRFENGKAIVVEDGQPSPFIIDKKGNVIGKSNIHLSMKNHLDGLKHEAEPVPFYENGLFGLKDKNGNVIVKAQYFSMSDFYEGLSVVVTRKKY
jgi:hypothetical protein